MYVCETLHALYCTLTVIHRYMCMCIYMRIRASQPLLIIPTMQFCIRIYAPFFSLPPLHATPGPRPFFSMPKLIQILCLQMYQSNCQCYYSCVHKHYCSKLRNYVVYDILYIHAYVAAVRPRRSVYFKLAHKKKETVLILWVGKLEGLTRMQ